MQSIRVAAAGFGLAALLVARTAPAAATAGAQGDVAGTGTSPAGVVVNEFAPSGWDSTDEFLELRNTSGQWVVLDGWELWACLSHSSPVLLAVFGSGDVMGPGGYLLLAHVNSSSSDGPFPPDYPYDGWDVPDDGGWLLSDWRSGRSDGVGLRSSVACTEGDLAPQCDWAAGEAATRDEQGKDTDDNAADFTCQARTPGWVAIMGPVEGCRRSHAWYDGLCHDRRLSTVIPLESPVASVRAVCGDSPGVTRRGERLGRDVDAEATVSGWRVAWCGST